MLPGQSRAELAATPLFVEPASEPGDAGPAGADQPEAAGRRLRELVDRTVTVAPGGRCPRSAAVDLDGLTHRLDLERPGRDFGQVRVRFPVPESRVRRRPRSYRRAR